MSLSKLYDRIDFENDTTPALNETNLNLISKAVDDIDDRVVDLSGEIMMADTYANNAATSATNAATSESNASGYADDAEASALVSEGYAAGTQNGVEVSSGTYYENNAKYYSEQAQTAVQNAMSAADYDPNDTVINAGGIDAYVTAQISALDVSDSAVSGSYVTAVSETDGAISVTREAADGTPTESSTKMVTSGGVYTALEDKVDCTTVSDEYDSATTYAVGDHFIYDNTVYEVDVACTGITPPNANYYTAYTITELIEANSSQISDLNSDITTLESDKVAWSDYSISGAVNLVTTSYHTLPSVINDVTFTVNSDLSITVSGTASAVTFFNLTSSTSPGLLKAGTYKKTATGNSNIQFNIYDKTSGNAIATGDAEGTFTLSEDTYIRCFYRIANGATVNETLYPMITFANYSGDWVSPVMTNQRITDIVNCPNDTDGTYTLQAVVSSGAVTYSWVASS